MKLENIISVQFIGIALGMFGAGGVFLLEYLGAGRNEIEYAYFLILTIIGFVLIIIRLDKLIKLSKDKELMRKEI